MHRLAFVVYLCSACRCVVLVLQYDSWILLCTCSRLSVRLTVILGLRLGIGLGVELGLGIGIGIWVGLGIRLGLGIGIANLNQIADLKLPILARIQIADLNLTPCIIKMVKQHQLRYTQA